MENFIFYIKKFEKTIANRRKLVYNNKKKQRRRMRRMRKMKELENRKAVSTHDNSYLIDNENTKINYVLK